MRSLLFAAAFLLNALFLSAQTVQIDDSENALYVGVGVHEAWFTNSDIHLMSSGTPPFDFTLKNVHGTDDKLLHSDGGPIEYNYEIGYYFKKKNFGIEYNFDHVKYFAAHNQTVRTVGTINGQTIDEMLPITTYVQNFEHTNGANYVQLKFVKWKDLLKSNNEKHVLTLMLKAGGGAVVPRTNSTIMNRHRDDTYNIAGYVAVLEGGLRYTFHKRFFVEYSFKGAYANYSHFLIYDGSGSQHWFSGQMLIFVGTQFHL